MSCLELGFIPHHCFAAHLSLFYHPFMRSHYSFFFVLDLYESIGPCLHLNLCLHDNFLYDLLSGDHYRSGLSNCLVLHDCLLLCSPLVLFVHVAVFVLVRGSLNDVDND